VTKLNHSTDNPAPLEAFGDGCYNTVVRFLKVFLLRDNKHLPASYESVYNACRTVVTVSGKGDGLYDNLRMSLEKCAGELGKELLNEKRRGVKWVVAFNEICAWFGAKVVSVVACPRFEVLMK
jgi:cullin-4